MTDEQTETAPQPTEPEPPAPTPDEQTPDELEPQDDEPPAPIEHDQQAMSERDIEKALAKLSSEAQRHRKRIDEIMGEDALALIPCVLCEPHIAGFHFPLDQTPDREQRIAAVKAAVGEALPELRNATNTRGCDDCDAEGRVLSGSKRDGFTVNDCATCSGRGWISVGGPETPPTGVNGPAVVVVPPAPVAGVGPDDEAKMQELIRKGFTVIAPLRVGAT